MTTVHFPFAGDADIPDELIPVKTILLQDFNTAAVSPLVNKNYGEFTATLKRRIDNRKQELNKFEQVYNIMLDVKTKYPEYFI